MFSNSPYQPLPFPTSEVPSIALGTARPSPAHKETRPCKLHRTSPAVVLGSEDGEVLVGRANLTACTMVGKDRPQPAPARNSASLHGQHPPFQPPCSSALSFLLFILAQLTIFVCQRMIAPSERTGTGQGGTFSRRGVSANRGSFPRSEGRRVIRADHDGCSKSRCKPGCGLGTPVHMERVATDAAAFCTHFCDTPHEH